MLLAPSGWYSDSYGGPTARRRNAFVREPFAWRTLGLQVVHDPQAAGVSIPFWLPIALLSLAPINELLKRMKGGYGFPIEPIAEEGTA
jgi:hypothetical protein